MARPELPVDPEDGPVARFAVGLRDLRQRAGSPGYRELARRAHYSPTTLAQAARGLRLPSLAVTLAFVRACGGDEAEWEERWRSTTAQLDPYSRGGEDDDRSADDRAPYVGLVAYGPEDAEWFCGRDHLVAALTERVARQRFVAVVGASGSGKSSLLRAGLLPSVSEEPDRWSTLVITPGAHPTQELAVRLGGRLGLPAGQLTTEFDEDPRNLGLAIRQVMATSPEGAELLVIVDQFEEVFTLCQDARERELFISGLLDAAGDPDSRTRVVVGLRADFYAHCSRHARLVEALQDAQVLVGPMSTDELVQAITQPAARAGLIVEKTLVTTVVHEAAERPGALPFVSHALWETWRRRHGNGLFLDGYRAAGGVNGAIAQTADRVYVDLDERQQQVAQGILLRLTALGEGTGDTRRRVPGTELGDAPTTSDVVNRLAGARLITLAEDTVEIAHEALIRSWPMLQTWLAEDREAVLAHRRLTDAAAEWEHHGRDEGLLYRGARLAGWQDRPLDRLNDVERAFLTAARRAEEREHHLRRRRVRLTIGGLSAAVVIVAVLAVVATVMAARAGDEQTVAVSRQLVADARTQLEVDPELALLLAREAYTRTPNDDTEALLRQATADSHVRATLPARWDSKGPVAITDVVFTPDGKHLVTADYNGVLQVRDWDAGKIAQSAPREVRIPVQSPRDVVFSPDGRHVAAATRRGVMSAQNWADGGEASVVPGHDDELCGLASSVDGQRMASGDVDGTIQVWNTAGDGQPTVLLGHDGPACNVAFSPDGQRLVSGGTDGTVRVWDLVGGGNPVVLRGHENGVTGVAFSPDGHHVATTSDDGTVRIWDPTGVTSSVVLGSHDDTAQSVTYSPDGHWIASTGWDGTVRIWNVDYRARSMVPARHYDAAVVLRGHRGGVVAAAFSPDGKSVVSAGYDGTVKVWDVDEVEQTTVLRGNEGLVSRSVPSQDGRQVASVSQDGTIRLWDIAGDSTSVVLPGGPHPYMHRLMFTPDGNRLLGVDNGTIFVWNTDGLTEPIQFRLPDLPVANVALSPDGRRLAVVAGLSNTVWLWNLNGTGKPDLLLGDEQLLKLRHHVYHIEWSPDGHHIATAYPDDDRVLLWDLRDLDSPTVLPTHESPVGVLTFSADGTRLASAGTDAIHLWNLADTANPIVFRSEQDTVPVPVHNVAFSHDGRHLITSGSDASIRVWKTDRAGQPLILDGFRAAVQDIAALTDDRYVTAHDDGTIRIWRCPACDSATEVLAHAKKHTTRQLTPEERRTYLPSGS